MIDWKGTFKGLTDAFTAVAPAASILARTSMAWSSARSAREGADFMREQASVERSISEARAERDSNTRTQRYAAAQSSQLALAAGRGVALDTFRGVDAGNKRELERDIGAINLNRLNRLTQLDFLENDAMRTAARTTRDAWLGAAIGNAGTLFGMQDLDPQKRGETAKQRTWVIPGSGSGNMGFGTRSQRT